MAESIGRNRPKYIERKIRAFNPWPGAFTTVTAKSGKPRNLKIFSASVSILAEQAGRNFATARSELSYRSRQTRALSLERRAAGRKAANERRRIRTRIRGGLGIVAVN